ncbi:Gfo/Idh/MocA family oxidoreductase [Brachybacterium sp. NBEC-018]|uniref:Gfo/Idh/MocA family protein n=1 Tax=Brachybacterium sp. NBEC-018 TaxID=2996004 RepID=UPI00217534BC|nr:Gfo/Idh/MocA family oxidoreductase [Brachybacterium sp. NBEC-018]UVY85238.1 Gfo/Idh/MocA family oxidoreductase [Brachybacterium sp. NBEC-018]
MSSRENTPGEPLVLPAPRTPEPAAAPGLRWGVVSPGHIGTQFTETAHRATASRVVSVVSRSAERARAFAVEHGADGAFTSVEEMLAAGGIDAVYVASPHAQHAELARPVLEAGIPVVVEKAFTLNAGQAAGLLDLARERGVFAMEAMWARFLPHYDVLNQVLESGLLGEIIEVAADHGQSMPTDPSHRMNDPELGGGALLDLGVYPVSFAQMVLGDLTDLAVRGDLTPTGVDASVGILARGERGRARLGTTLRARTPTEAVISGTAGQARLAGAFFAPTTLTVTLLDGRRASFEAPGIGGDGMAYEIAEAARRITAGDLESPLMSWADTLSVMNTLDAVRAELGVVYPGEAAR